MMRKLALVMLLAGCGTSASASRGDSSALPSEAAGAVGVAGGAIAGAQGVSRGGQAGAAAATGGAGSAPYVSVPVGASPGGNPGAGAPGGEAGAPQGGGATMGGSAGAVSLAGGAGQPSGGAPTTCNGEPDLCQVTDLGCAACAILDCAGYVKKNGACGLVSFYSVSIGDRVEFPAGDAAARATAKSVALQDCFTKQPSHPILCQ